MSLYDDVEREARHDWLDMRHLHASGVCDCCDDERDQREWEHDQEMQEDTDAA